MRNDAKKVIVRRKGLATSSRMPVLDHDYREWIGELKKRYRATQIKAAVAVNPTFHVRPLVELFSQR